MAQESPASDNVAKAPLRQVALVALGGNVTSHFGKPLQTMDLACQRLASDSVRIEQVSRYFMTPCFPIGAGPDYINAAAILSTTLSPAGLLAVLHQTEADLGRQRLQRWGNRTLDLDLLAFGDIISPSTDRYRLWQDLAPDQQKLRAPDELILPHPRMHERAFVLVPLLEIAPDWRHPVLGLSVRQMVDALPPGDVDAVVPVPRPFS